MVYWNNHYNDIEGATKGTADCSTTSECVQFNPQEKSHFNIDYFEETSRGRPDELLNKKGCENYAKKHSNRTWGGLINKAGEISGCHSNFNTLYYNNFYI